MDSEHLWLLSLLLSPLILPKCYVFTGNYRTMESEDVFWGISLSGSKIKKEEGGAPRANAVLFLIGCPSRGQNSAPWQIMTFIWPFRYELSKAVNTLSRLHCEGALLSLSAVNSLRDMSFEYYYGTLRFAFRLVCTFFLARAYVYRWHGLFTAFMAKCYGFFYATMKQYHVK